MGRLASWSQREAGMHSRIDAPVVQSRQLLEMSARGQRGKSFRLGLFLSHPIGWRLMPADRSRR